MTGFGSLYYTDCVPGQGLQGGAGFQFQAASPGLASEAMSLVQRVALYEAPVSWMRERRPVADYPRSLAHTSEAGLLLTAAGRYLGKEANGSREGNQFTHAVVTRDPADYGTLRPAQLWDATWWADAPAAGGVELDELPAVPADVPLDLETVHERIRSTDGAEDMLTALLSAVERLAVPDERCPLVLVTADPERAACWIAAATILRPQSEALRVGFKIFVAEPQHGRHDIIALHPEWAGRSADTARGSGLAVFDLDRGRHTPAEPTASACFWVPRFLRADPYDVQDAVELSDQLARARTAEPGQIERLISAVVAMNESLTVPADLQAAARWLLDAPAEIVDLARDQVLDTVLATEPPAAVLRTLHDAAQNRGWSAAAGLRSGLLTAEIDEALLAPDGVAATVLIAGLSPLAPSPAGAGRDVGVERLETALRDARPDQVPALLTVAARHGVRPDPNRYNSAADGFARWWIERAGRPEVAGLDLRTWRVVPEAVDMVRDVLHQQMQSAERAAAVAAVHGYWWTHLLPDAQDPADPLDEQVFRAAHEKLDRQAARDLLGRVLDRARDVRGPRPADEVAWHALFAADLPQPDIAYHFLHALRDRDLAVSPRVLDLLVQVIDREPRPSYHGLWVSHELVHRLDVVLPPRLAEQRLVDDVLCGAIRAVEQGDPDSRRLATEIEGASRDLVAVRMPALTTALLDAPSVVAVGVLLCCSRALMIDLTRRVERLWPRGTEPVDPHGHRAAALTFLLVTDPDGESRRQDLGVLRERLKFAVKGMPIDVRRAIDVSYDPPLETDWWTFLEEIDAGRVKRWLRSEDRPRRGRTRSDEARGARDPMPEESGSRAWPTWKRGR